MTNKNIGNLTNAATGFGATDRIYVGTSPFNTALNDWYMTGATLKSLFLQPVNNLSDVSNTTTARNSLSLGILDTPTFAGLTLTSGAFTGTITEAALTASRAYSLPNNGGTIALTSDLPTQYWTLATTTLSPITATYDISTQGDYIWAASGDAFTTSVLRGTLAASNTLTLPITTGTIALTSDIPTQYWSLATTTLSPIVATYDLSTQGNYVWANSGDAFTTTIQRGAIGASTTLTLPTTTGTLALSSAIPTQYWSLATTVLSPIVDTYDISTKGNYIWQGASYKTTIQLGALAGDITLTLPITTGTLALIADLPTQYWALSGSVLTPATDTNDISTKGNFVWKNGSNAFTTTIQQGANSASTTLTLPISTGTVALTSDLPTQYWSLATSTLSPIVATYNISTQGNYLWAASGDAFTTTIQRGAIGASTVLTLPTITGTLALASAIPTQYWSRTSTTVSPATATDDISTQGDYVWADSGDAFLTTIQRGAIVASTTLTLPTTTGTLALTGAIPTQYWSLATTTLSPVVATYDVSTQGDFIWADSGDAFTTTIQRGALGASTTLTLPTSSGTLALTSQLITQYWSRASTTLSPVNAGDDISTTGNFVWSSTHDTTIQTGSPGAAVTLTLPTTTGTLALTSALPTQYWSLATTVLSPSTATYSISTQGDYIWAASGDAFTTTISRGALAASTVLTLPITTGTLALTSQLITQYWSRAGSIVSPLTATDDVSTQGSYKWAASGDAFVTTMQRGALAASTTLTLPITTGTVALTSDLPTQYWSLATTTLSPVVATYNINTQGDFIWADSGDAFTTTIQRGALAASTTLTLPTTSGTLALTGAIPTQYWSRASTTLSPVNAGDDISTTGNFVWEATHNTTIQTGSPGAAITLTLPTSTGTLALTSALPTQYWSLATTTLSPIVATYDLSTQGDYIWADSGDAFTTTIQRGAIAASTILTLPITTGTLALASAIPSQYWSRAGTTVSPATATDNISTQGGYYWAAAGDAFTTLIQRGALGASTTLTLPTSSGTVALTSQLITQYWSLATTTLSPITATYSVSTQGDYIWAASGDAFTTTIQRGALGASTTLTLPTSSGTVALTSQLVTQYWSRAGTVVSPLTAGDDISTTGHFIWADTHNTTIQGGSPGAAVTLTLPTTTGTLALTSALPTQYWSLATTTLSPSTATYSISTQGDYLWASSGDAFTTTIQRGALAASTVLALPTSSGTLALTSQITGNYWQRVGTVLSPVTAGDDVSTSGHFVWVDTHNTTIQGGSPGGAVTLTLPTTTGTLALTSALPTQYWSLGGSTLTPSTATYNINTQGSFIWAASGDAFTTTIQRGAIGASTVLTLPTSTGTFALTSQIGGYWSQAAGTLKPTTATDNVNTQGNFIWASSGDAFTTSIQRGAIGASTTLTLPATTGTLALTSAIPTQYWSRASTTVSPVNSGDDISTTGNFVWAATHNTTIQTGGPGAAVTLTLPTTTGTLALTSQLPTQYWSLATTTLSPITATYSISTQGNYIWASSGDAFVTTVSRGAIAASTALTLPATAGTLALTSQLPTQYWGRAGTVLSPATSGDDISTTGHFVWAGANNTTIQSGGPGGAVTLTLPTTTGTLALTSQLPTQYWSLAATTLSPATATYSISTQGNYVWASSGDAFTTTFQRGALGASNTITLPTSTGTLALTSALPTQYWALASTTLSPATATYSISTQGNYLWASSGDAYTTTIQRGAIGASTVLTLPTTTGTLALVGGSSGAVVQVKSTTKTSVFTAATTGFTDVTGLSVAITPTSSSNNILVFAQVYIGNTPSGYTTQMLIVRGSTSICIGDAASTRTRASGDSACTDNSGTVPLSQCFLDSPATTSATTYKIQVRSASNDTVYINQSKTDTDDPRYPRLVSTITVMEVTP